MFESPHPENAAAGETTTPLPRVPAGDTARLGGTPAAPPTAQQPPVPRQLPAQQQPPTGPAQQPPPAPAQQRGQAAAMPPTAVAQPQPQLPPLPQPPLPQPQAQRSRPPTRQAGRRRSGRYLLYGLGLLGVAVVSGLLWWTVSTLIGGPRGGSGATGGSATTTDATGGPTTAGGQRFAQAHGAVRGTDCVGHSYGKAQRFFREHPCDQLTRTLYVTTVHGVRVFSSVSQVQMPDETTAAALERLTDQNGTGNVTDLLTDGITAPGAPATVKGGGYASARDGNTVIIVESGPARGKHLPDAVITRISRDALGLAEH